MTIAGVKTQADAVARAFVSQILTAEREDVPLIRLVLGSRVSKQSPDPLMRDLAAIQPTGPALLAVCSDSARLALDRLGDLIESQESLDDDALLAGLKEFAYLMMRALEPGAP